MAETIQTDLTKLLGIKYPIMLAGMNKASGSKLAAAVTNAGGLGVIGGLGFTPRILRMTIKHIKRQLNDPSAPFGVDLLLPKVGEGARKTNYDYTKGQLPELIDIIIEEGARLFVCAVGVPPVQVVERLHQAGILVMNMIGAPKHVAKALAAGVDIICAQGGEGGGHTGDVATSILLPKVVDLCKGHKSPLTGGPVHVVGAGGIFDGRGVAAALSYGCEAVWVGTRFVLAEEAGAALAHKEAIAKAGYHDTYRTLVYTGRPLRVVKNQYADNWHENRKEEMQEALDRGVVPYTIDVDRAKKLMAKSSKSERNRMSSIYAQSYNSANPHLSGAVAGALSEGDIQPAKVIVESMMREAVAVIKANHGRVVPLRSRL